MSPYAMLPPCRHPRCPNRNDCQIHARPTTAQAKGYDHVWRKWRATTIERHHLQHCGDRPAGAPRTTDSTCLQGGRVSQGKVLDHIERIDGPDDARRLDERNVQLLCSPCHDRKRQRESQQPFTDRPRASSRDEIPTWG